jgi:hypothetical protein
LSGGSVVRLQHTENGGFLTSDDIDFTEDGLSEVYVRKNKFLDDERYQTGDLFEIEVANNFNRGRYI